MWRGGQPLHALYAYGSYGAQSEEDLQQNMPQGGAGKCGGGRKAGVERNPQSNKNGAPEMHRLPIYKG